MSPFDRLLALFRARFFENDALTPEGGFETNIYQVLGFLVTPGLFINTLFAFLELGDLPSGPALDWIIRIHRLVFPAFSFAVTGFASIFEWDMLFPDRRDFLILSAFPVQLRTLFAAKVAALGGFLLLLIAAVNFFPVVMTPLFPAATPQIREAGRLRMFAAQIAATGGASVFGFLAVATFHGLLINVTSPRMFRRLSPWTQVAGMSLMTAALLLYPVYSLLLPSMARIHPNWLYFLPPVWFTGFYDLILPTHTDPFFASLGFFGLKALAVVFVVSALAWAGGFRRHDRRTLETEDTESRTSRFSMFGWLSAPPEENAIFQFTGRILARSARHRLFLATYWSVGISIGLLTTVIVKDGKLGVSQDGLRSFPLLLAFFIGLRFPRRYPVSGRVAVELVVSSGREQLVGDFAARHAKAGADERTGAGTSVIPSIRNVAMGWNRGVPSRSFPDGNGRIAGGDSVLELRQSAVHLFLLSGKGEPCVACRNLRLWLYRVQLPHGRSGNCSRWSPIPGAPFLWGGFGAAGSVVATASAGISGAV